MDTVLTLSDSTKDGKFLDLLSDYQLFTLSSENMNAWSFASGVPMHFYGFVLKG